MASALPAINTGGSMLAQSPSIQQHRIASPPSKPGSGKIMIGTIEIKRSQGKRERELQQRRFRLRQEQPDLTKPETSRYRNSHKHTLFLEMLREGYHKSFAELFALIKQQNERRLAAGPESLIWTMVLLENEAEKMETLKLYLTQAEASLRKENYSDVYKCQFKLARYFQSTGDKWLSDHFFNNCLRTSMQVKGDDGKMAAEGHCNVGLAREENGEIVDAMDNFELFYKLCKDKPDWELEGGEPMHVEACNHLSRIYTSIAEKEYASVEDVDQQLHFLKKAYEMAKEGGDRKLAGEASFRLGVAYERNNTPGTALHYLTNYLETCRTLNDDQGMGKACEAIAKAYEKDGKIEESIHYLEMFVEVAESIQDDKAISRASSCLGAMFNSLGRYDSAVEHFNKAYNIARSMNDHATISSSRVLFGVATAHKMMQHYAKHVHLSSRPCLERLVEWKDNRGDEFEKEVPVGGSRLSSAKSQTDAPKEEAKEEEKEETPAAEEAKPEPEKEPAEEPEAQEAS